MAKNLDHIGLYFFSSWDYHQKHALIWAESPVSSSLWRKLKNNTILQEVYQGCWICVTSCDVLDILQCAGSHQKYVIFGVLLQTRAVRTVLSEVMCCPTMMPCPTMMSCLYLYFSPLHCIIPLCTHPWYCVYSAVNATSEKFHLIRK